MNAIQAPHASAPIGRVLVVDDDRFVLRGFASVLRRQGWTVDTALDGIDAKALIAQHPFDVIISDVHMPGCGGLTFLRAVRERDADVPVILVSGQPSVDSSLRAIEHGVFRYLVKPVANATLLETTTQAARLHRFAQLKRRALDLVGSDVRWLDDRATIENRFASAFESLSVAFQPIVSWRNRKIFGYEALLRTGESALASPSDFIAAAERLGRVSDLGRAIRQKVAEAARRLPTDVKLFVNLHPSDLDDSDLRDAYAPLSGIAHRVVLEVTERASLENVMLASERVAALKAMGFRIALDDLGAGYAGLTSFTQLEPEFVKLDMTLVRGIDRNATKRHVIAAMKNLCDELGVRLVAEGIETPPERDTLVEIGCDLFQGFLFGRPACEFAPAIW